MEKGAATLKRLFLELGGKSATIVLDDADFATAMMAGLAVCFHAGQGCAIQTRMLLPRSRYEEGVELLKAYWPESPTATRSAPTCIMGPLISGQAARPRRSATSRRAWQRAPPWRSAAAARATCRKGWYVEPTLFTDVDNSMTIAQEEIFGPVLVVIPFEDDDDAVAHRQRQQLRPGGAVVSASLERALAVARRVRTGILSVNGGMTYRPTCPSAATRTAASAGRTASPASTSTSRPSPWPGPPAEEHGPHANERPISTNGRRAPGSASDPSLTTLSA